MTPACGGDDGGTSPAADAAPGEDSRPANDAAVPLTELDALCAEDGPVVEVVQRMAECNGIAAGFGILDTGFYTGETLAPVCRSWYEDFFADGSVTVDEDAIPACLDYLDDTPCESVGAFSHAEAIFSGGSLEALRGTPCDLIFVGRYEELDTCDISGQCAGDSYCGELPPVFGVQEDCNRCHPALANGEACTADLQCSSGLCNEDDECAVPGELGDACTGDDDCLVDLLCDEVSLECVRRSPVEGAACANNTDCGGYVLGLYCDLEDTETCLPLPGVGETCVGTGDIRCNLLDYNWCDTNVNACAAPEISQEGEPCNILGVIDGGARRCADGLACSDLLETDDDGFALGRCYVPRVPGEGCGIEANGTDACRAIYSCTDNVCAELPNAYTGLCTGEQPPS